MKHDFYEEQLSFLDQFTKTELKHVILSLLVDFQLSHPAINVFKDMLPDFLEVAKEERKQKKRQNNEPKK